MQATKIHSSKPINPQNPILSGLKFRAQIASFVRRHWHFLGWGVCQHLSLRLRYAGREDQADFVRLDELLTNIKEDRSLLEKVNQGQTEDPLVCEIFQLISRLNLTLTIRPFSLRIAGWKGSSTIYYSLSFLQGVNRVVNQETEYRKTLAALSPDDGALPLAWSREKPPENPKAGVFRSLLALLMRKDD